jgi:hypothetical protein
LLDSVLALDVYSSFIHNLDVYVEQPQQPLIGRCRLSTIPRPWPIYQAFIAINTVDKRPATTDINKTIC